MIFVISGPSGSGKTTLLKHLIQDKQLKHKLVKSVSLATRPRRSGERDKRDYFFISKEEFRKRLKAKKILEWTKYLGYYYATPRDYVEGKLSRGRHLALCLDFRGAKRLRRLYPKETRTIFIEPPSVKELKSRIEKRCNKTKKDEIRRRIKLAKEEIALSKKYDYCLLNKDLDKSTDELKNIILKEINQTR